MIIQGNGIVDLEDMDQDMFEEWRKLDMMGRPLLDLRPNAPPGVILLYSLNIHKIKTKTNNEG